MAPMLKPQIAPGPDGLCAIQGVKPADHPTAGEALVAPGISEVASRAMGYKVLGFAVWQGTKWYMRRRTTSVKAKLAMAGVGALVVAGAAAAGRQAASHQ